MIDEHVFLEVKDTGTNTITAKDLYQEAWKCRDFEIEHLWQRSVFLASFMLAIAAGYGALLSKIVFPEKATTDMTVPHLLAVGICYLGFVFSMLWVMMSKGSKYWYECYENAINYFVYNFGHTISPEKEENNKVFDESSIRWCLNSPNQNLEYFYDVPMHGTLPKPREVDKSLFTPKPCRYSVSSVNCVIGVIGMFCWTFLIIVHGALFFRSYKELGLNGFQSIYYSVLQTLFFLPLLWFFLKKYSSRGDGNNEG